MWPPQRGLVSLHWHQRGIGSVVLNMGCGCQPASVFKSRAEDCWVSIIKTTYILTFYCSIFQMQYQGWPGRCRHFEWVQMLWNSTLTYSMCIRHINGILSTFICLSIISFLYRRTTEKKVLWSSYIHLLLHWTNLHPWPRDFLSSLNIIVSSRISKTVIIEK